MLEFAWQINALNSMFAHSVHATIARSRRDFTFAKVLIVDMFGLVAICKWLSSDFVDDPNQLPQASKSFYTSLKCRSLPTGNRFQLHFRENPNICVNTPVTSIDIQ